MAYLAVDADGTEWVFDACPRYNGVRWESIDYYQEGIELPSGSIAKLIGRGMTWEDEPYELK